MSWNNVLPSWVFYYPDYVEHMKSIGKEPLSEEEFNNAGNNNNEPVRGETKS